MHTLTLALIALSPLSPLSPLSLLSALSPAACAQEPLVGKTVGALPERPFGQEFPLLDVSATGAWWQNAQQLPKAQRDFVAALELEAPRAQSVAFALYTVEAGVLKLSAQLYPQRPGAATLVRLELETPEGWVEAARTQLCYPGWSAHFRLSDWDSSLSRAYRVRHGEAGLFEGLVRRDPLERDELRVAVMSCNGTYDPRESPHARTVANLRELDPDLLFFAGDQHYQHTQHTAGWIAFGLAFADVLRDRPVVTIPDDHDVGHPNLWGEAGGRSERGDGADGGYRFPPAYVNMVQSQQCWHLPDPFDPTPCDSGIGVYYTRLRVGGIDFAILEDRKFKTGPFGSIPKLGPRPDHILDPAYDPASIDLPGLELLGPRQLRFLADWGEDWSGARAKVALSQTAFCGAVHLHGEPDNRLLADLDCNGWPQSGRNAALRLLRAVAAPHLCGDQHLAVVVQHGIEGAHDGPYAFTAPALYNSIYGRWWKPADGRPGAEALEGSPLAWTGDYRDGLGNSFRMLAYANPSFDRQRALEQRADGFGLVRFDKRADTLRVECWSRFADVRRDAQFLGWPLTLRLQDNDPRAPVAWLPHLRFDVDDAVVQVRDAHGEVLYTRRIRGLEYDPPVFAPGDYVLRAGRDRPERELWRGAAGERAASALEVEL